jgi:hypothetical protein
MLHRLLMHCFVYWYTVQRQSITDIVLLSFESRTHCICMVSLRICNSTLCSVYLINTHKTQRMSGQQLINSLHRITCSLIISTITVYVMTEQASWSYLWRLLYRHLISSPLGLLSHAPFCHLFSLVVYLCYISLFLYAVVSAFILVCLLPFQRKKEVEILLFFDGTMNESFDIRHDSQLSHLRISVVLFNPSRHFLTRNMQPNTTSSQVNYSNYHSLSCNKTCIAIKVSLNIERNNILKAVKRRPFALNSAGLPGDLMILILHYVNKIYLIIKFLSLSLSNINNQS